MKFRKSQFVFYSCLSFIFGVGSASLTTSGLASFFAVPWVIIYLAVLLGIILIIFSRPKSLLKMIVFCFLFFAFGIVRYQLSIPNINQNHIAYYNSQEIVFKGIIADEPDVRLDHIKYRIKALDYQGKVLVKANLYPRYQYGDVLEISCKLSQPEPIEDFKYDRYLAKSDIYSVCYRGQIKLIGHNQANPLKSAILKIKDKVVWVASQILPEPQSSFLGGLLWGAKKGLPQEILDNFSRTGVTHIIAVSGYNITIIATMLNGLFISFGLGRKKSFWLIVLAVTFFIIITGFPASIIRAGIMGVIILMSQTLGRASKIKNTLAITCLIMLLFNPKVLIWDAGFQLSFLATIGLVYLSPLISRQLKSLPNPLSIRDSLSTTLSAIIFTAPLILWQFGRFSVVAPLANLLILPVIPVTMLVGFLAVIAGLIWLPLAQLLAWAAWVLLTYILEVVRILANFSWSSIAL